MKRILSTASAVLLAIALAASPVAARLRDPSLTFTTAAVGTVHVEATWTPKAGTQYDLDVKHLTNPADTFSYDVLCSVSNQKDGTVQPLTTSALGSTLGRFVCDIPSGPVGYWTVLFYAVTGGVASTITVSHS